MVGSGSRARPFVIFALVLVALIVISNLCDEAPIETPPNSEPSFQDLVARDPLGFAERQYELASADYADGYMPGVVVHAYQATLAAFESVPEEGTAWRAERGITVSEDEIDIWERGRVLAAVAQASTSWASVRHGMRPDNHAENYDNASIAWADSRDAQQGINEIWQMTRVHWDEHRRSATEDAWADCALAWAYAASAWDLAYDLVDDFFAGVLAAWSENL